MLSAPRTFRSSSGHEAVACSISPRSAGYLDARSEAVVASRADRQGQRSAVRLADTVTGEA